MGSISKLVKAIFVGCKCFFGFGFDPIVFYENVYCV